MGTITRKENKYGAVKYIVQHRITGLPSECRQFDDEHLAKEYHVKREAELRLQLTSMHRGYKVKDFMDLCFADVMREYLRLNIKKHKNGIHMFLPFVEKLTIQELTRAKIKELIPIILNTTTYQKLPYKAGTIGKMFTCSTAVWNWKLEQMNLPDMPSPFKQEYISQVAGPLDCPRDRRLAPREEMLLRDRLARVEKHGEWMLILDLALETAARQQELVLATWSEFDLQAGVWTMPKEHTKAKKSRVMPLSRKAMELLREHAIKNRHPEPHERVFMFLQDTGTVSAVFRKMVRQAGIEDFHFHDLRHEAISRIVLYRRQMTIYEIMKMVGHSSLEMLNRYANLRGDELSARFNIM